MTVKQFLETGDKRTKAYRDLKEYVEIVKHHQPEKVDEVLKKKVVEIIGIEK